ncbi:60S ribosomal protein L13a [Hondaea fermentalgiana]|uniref:60S ribosomal protein L13a n=1 Tax=Hondaea fermentalgiana TaxID=2315210 RepID=A0A2R5GQJ6_9STRA|nr:60S ribosomal protein L13a [Hondaea fermentalgiana]|eukprot:GBG32885.1 60S ribosomal protein L13a [Hondaea fermentalgiana]
MFERVIVVDCRGHLMGRLASIIAKELLCGQRVVAVRCEELEISGHKWRNRIKLENKFNKKMNSNPERGPFSLRSPKQQLTRMIRGMIPHKTARGKAAMIRLKAFEGIPHPYDRMKRMVIPEALKVLRLRPGRKSTNLGELTASYGWKHKEVVATLEEKRKVKSAAYYERKVADQKLLKQAREEADIPEDAKQTLEQFGY